MLIANTQGLLHSSVMAGAAGEQLGQVMGQCCGVTAPPGVG